MSDRPPFRVPVGTAANPVLDLETLARLRSLGVSEDLAEGVDLFRMGDSNPDLFVVESGRVNIIREATAGFAGTGRCAVAVRRVPRRAEHADRPVVIADGAHGRSRPRLPHSQCDVPAAHVDRRPALRSAARHVPGAAQAADGRGREDRRDPRPRDLCCGDGAAHLREPHGAAAPLGRRRERRRPGIPRGIGAHRGRASARADARRGARRCHTEHAGRSGRPLVPRRHHRRSRPRGRRGGSGGARGRHLRCVRGPVDPRARRHGARRPGRGELEDRELPRVPLRPLGRRAHRARHRAGAQVRRAHLGSPAASPASSREPIEPRSPWTMEPASPPVR